MATHPPGPDAGGSQPSSKQDTNPPPRQGLSMITTPQGKLFLAHVAILVLTVLFLQPLNRQWSAFAWRFLMQLCALTSAYKVYLKYGLPKLRPFPGAIKAWLQPAAAASDFQYLVLSSLFLNAPRPMFLIAVPFAVLAAFHASAFASQAFGRTGLWQKYGRRLHLWLASNQQQALMLNAAAEIGTGFMSVLALMAPPRSLLLPFMVWQILKMRYWSPDAAAYHRQVWGLLDQRFQPLADRLPLLRTPVGFAQRWFNNGR